MVIITDMDMPQNCNKCGCHNGCGCCDFGDDIRVDYEATKRPLGCPLKSADENRGYWMNDLDKLSEQIAEYKVIQTDRLNNTNNAFLTEYLKGYICAFSFVEGMIAELRGEVCKK